MGDLFLLITHYMTIIMYGVAGMFLRAPLENEIGNSNFETSNSQSNDKQKRTFPINNSLAEM